MGYSLELVSHKQQRDKSFCYGKVPQAYLGQGALKKEKLLY